MLGLILPSISFIFAILLAMNIFNFASLVTSEYMEVTVIDNGTTYTYTFDTTEEMNDFIDSCDENIEIINYRATTGDGELRYYILTIIIVFIFSNIPTTVFLLIYFGCRRKKKDLQREELNKMNIDDLGS